MFKLKINNYRCFLGDNLNFSKVNILIGENNAGKSSILNFFRLLRQSLDLPFANFNLRGPYIDMGTYKEIVYKNDTDRNISFEFEFNSKNLDSFLNFFQFSKKPEEREIEKNFYREKLPDTLIDSNNIYIETSGKLESHNFLKTVICNPSLGEIEIMFPEEMLSKVPQGDIKDYCQLKYKRITSGDEIILRNISYNQQGFLSFVNSNSLFEVCKNSNSIENIFYEIAYLLITQNTLKSYLGRMQYINPVLSFIPHKYYERGGNIISNPFSNSLESFIEILNSLDKESRYEVINKLNQLLKEYGIADEIEINIHENLEITEIRAKVKDMWSNLRDVGFGVVMQLPILLGLLLYKNSILLIEVPEVHLYNNFVAKLVDVLIKYSENTILIIETHSEYIIRELQVLVKEQKLKSEDVSISFFEREKDKTSITNHKIKSNGAITPRFRSGFIDNTYRLAKQLLK